MKRMILAFCVVVCAARAVGAQQAGDLGAGFVLGNPSGFTFKYWVERAVAIDGGVGYSGDPAFYADVAWHAWDLFAKQREGRIGGYLGVGPRVELGDDGEFGIRTMLGLTYWLPRHPLELFFEAGPVFRLTQGGSVEADGGVGLRVYFGGTGPARAVTRLPE